MKRAWRDHLTAEERRELEVLEFQANVLDDVRRDFNARRRVMTAKLNTLRNRACQRARAAAGELNKGRCTADDRGQSTEAGSQQ